MVDGDVRAVRVLEERLRHSRFAQIRRRHELGLLLEDEVVGIHFEVHESVSFPDECPCGQARVAIRFLRLDSDVPAAFLVREILFAVVVLRAVAVDVAGDVNGLRHLDVQILVAGDALLRERRLDPVDVFFVGVGMPVERLRAGEDAVCLPVLVGPKMFW